MLGGTSRGTRHSRDYDMASSILANCGSSQGIWIHSKMKVGTVLERLPDQEDGISTKRIRAWHPVRRIVLCHRRCLVEATTNIHSVQSHQLTWKLVPASEVHVIARRSSDDSFTLLLEVKTHVVGGAKAAVRSGGQNPHSGPCNFVA